MIKVHLLGQVDGDKDIKDFLRDQYRKVLLKSSKQDIAINTLSDKLALMEELMASMIDTKVDMMKATVDQKLAVLDGRYSAIVDRFAKVETSHYAYESSISSVTALVDKLSPWQVLERLLVGKLVFGKNLADILMLLRLGELMTPSKPTRMVKGA